MDSRQTSNARSARELEGAQRQPGTGWGGNRRGQWTILALFALALAVVAGTLVLIA